MTTSALPAHYDSRLCRSFLHVAGARRFSKQDRASWARFFSDQLGIKSPAKIRIGGAFVKSSPASSRLWSEQIFKLKGFYRIQMAINSLTQRIFTDWFSRVGLHFREKARLGTRLRWAAETAARMTVRVK